MNEGSVVEGYFKIFSPSQDAGFPRYLLGVTFQTQASTIRTTDFLVKNMLEQYFPYIMCVFRYFYVIIQKEK